MKAWSEFNIGCKNYIHSAEMVTIGATGPDRWSSTTGKQNWGISLQLSSYMTDTDFMQRTKVDWQVPKYRLFSNRVFPRKIGSEMVCLVQNEIGLLSGLTRCAFPQNPINCLIWPIPLANHLSSLPGKLTRNGLSWSNAFPQRCEGEQ